MTDLMKPCCLDAADFGGLLSALKERGYALVGPRKRDDAIVYDEIDSVADLPVGWGDDQEAGTYRLRKRDDKAMFGFNSGPHSWKKFLYPAQERLWSAERTPNGFSINPEPEPKERYAFIGVYSCDLHAIEVQDKIFMSPEFADPRYGKRRNRAFVVVANCGQASRSCFCASMGTGPKADKGFDLAFTEIIEAGGLFSKGKHYFVFEAGSERGQEILATLKTRPATAEDLEAAQKRSEEAKEQQIRKIDLNGIKELFYGNYDSPVWNKVAERCLSCANCTLVCPTCFCSNMYDTTDLTGDNAERWREWDSCFTLNFSYIHGGEVRPSVSARYRQWISHKMASWIDQFGTPGCVGCGRCITWCPVGIDITEETHALRAAAARKGENGDAGHAAASGNEGA